MDVLNIRGGDRNGLNGEFFNFAPLAPFAVAPVSAVVGAKARKRTKAKYANAETQRLAEAYPEQDNVADQSAILQQLLAESAATLQLRNKSKGKKRAILTGKLRAYDEYIRDYQSRLNELQTAESQVKLVKVSEQPTQPETPRIETINEAMPEISPKLKSEEGKPPRTEAMVKPTQTDVTTEQMVVAPKKNNTLLYLGIGAVLVVGFLIMRKK